MKETADPVYFSASFMERTNSSTCGGASLPYLAMILTMAEPTMAPSERSAMARACAGVEIPKPIAKGTCAFSRMARVTAERSVVISLRCR